MSHHANRELIVALIWLWYKGCARWRKDNPGCCISLQILRHASARNNILTCMILQHVTKQRSFALSHHNLLTAQWAWCSQGSGDSPYTMTRFDCLPDGCTTHTSSMWVKLCLPNSKAFLMHACLYILVCNYYACVYHAYIHTHMCV